MKRHLLRTAYRSSTQISNARVSGSRLPGFRPPGARVSGFRLPGARVSGARLKLANSQTAGIVSVELAILAVALLGGIQMLFFAGRIAEARSSLQDFVAEAARVASQAQNAADASSKVAEFAFQNRPARSGVNVGSATHDCGQLQVEVQTEDFARGGQITVTAKCSIQLSDLILLRLPGIATLSASATEIIDFYRSNPI